MSICKCVIDDLLLNKLWHAALQISLFDKSVVAAREFPNSPLVVFIPLSNTVKLSDMNLYISRVKQLALDLATGDITIQRHADSYASDRHRDPCEGPGIDLSTPDIFRPRVSLGRFEKDFEFTQDKCLQIHRELEAHRLEYEQKRAAEQRVLAHVQEHRLGLFSSDEETPNTQEVLNSDNSSLTNSDSPLIDLDTSVIFVFHDGPTLSYFQGAAGLAPPYSCPDDSDDEKPIEVVQKLIHQESKKRTLEQSEG